MVLGLFLLPVGVLGATMGEAAAGGMTATNEY